MNRMQTKGAIRMHVGMNVYPYRSTKRSGVVIEIIDAGTVRVDWSDEMTVESVDNIGEIVPPWSSIEVFPMTLSFDRHGNTYRRTQKCNWCSADSVEFVSRTSTISGHRHTDAACEIHAEEWRNAGQALTTSRNHDTAAD